MPVNDIDIYNQAVKQLEKQPNSPEFQHRAVLALARSGSLDFAVKEYHRYGLDKITSHPDTLMLEDIISLGGRLLKDLYLVNSGDTAINYALQSSEKYEEAFKRTDGYYSAINAATMALIANMPQNIVSQRAEGVLNILPASENIDSETRYFIQATRAEAALLLGQQYKSQLALKLAVEHDPQNYIAHATTLNQLDMILKKRGESTDWLQAFRPPKPMHFAGHLFKIGNSANIGELENADYETLRIDISDTLQRNNIGFGYGSLAAGADITFAEILLEEGGALHAILPVEPELFIQHSVLPFGQDWVDRFKACWHSATSRHIISTKHIWPNAHIDDFASQVAMGKAVRMAQRFSVSSQQLLLWDKQPKDQGTGLNAKAWAATGRAQTIFPYLGKRRLEKNKPRSGTDIAMKVTLYQKNTAEVSTFQNLADATARAVMLQNQHGHKLQLGLHVDISINGEIDATIAKNLAHKALPGNIFVSEAAASLLIFQNENEYDLGYLGQFENNMNPIHIFALKQIHH